MRPQNREKVHNPLDFQRCVGECGEGKALIPHFSSFPGAWTVSGDANVEEVEHRDEAGQSLVQWDGGIDKLEAMT